MGGGGGGVTKIVAICQRMVILLQICTDTVDAKYKSFETHTTRLQGHKSQSKMLAVR